MIPRRSSPSPRAFKAGRSRKCAARFKQIGLDGLDLTVRPGGHIDPADAVKRLPEAVKAARDEGVQIAMLYNRDHRSRLASRGTAGDGRWPGRSTGSSWATIATRSSATLAKEIDAAKTKLAGVAKLAARHGVLPCVHIHSGDTIPSGGTVAYLLLKDFSTRASWGRTSIRCT